jgi:signal transduction histidine kinase
MRAEPEHRVILAIDIQGFGRLERNNLARCQMRTGLHRALGKALSAARIAPGYIEQAEYGDGILVLLSPLVSKARLLHPFLPRLLSGLARYNSTASDAARLRVRVVIHAGELVRDAHGITGEDLILAYRLLDADIVRASLRRASTDLVLIVSEVIYQGVVKHGYGRTDPAVFRPVWVTVKETSTRAWLHVPGTRHQDLPAPEAGRDASSVAVRPELASLAQPSPAVTPSAGRRLSGTWQIPAYAYVEGCQVSGSWMHVGDPMATSIGYPADVGNAPNFWKTVLHPADRDRIIAADQWSEQTLEPFRMTYRSIAQNGRCVWLRDECVAMYDHTGMPRYWLGAVFELADHLMTEVDATRRLEILNALSVTFFRVASRKLRVPLTGILGTCRALQQAGDRLPKPANRELISGVAATVRQLDRILADVIDLQRLSWGAVTLDRRPFDVAALVQQTASPWRVRSNWPHVSAASSIVHLDGAKVARIIEELLANAFTHTPSGTPVWVRVTRHGTGVLMTVEDAGPGLPVEVRTAVFERLLATRVP